MGVGFQRSDFAFQSLAVSLPDLRPGEHVEMGIELGDICASGTSLSLLGQVNPLSCCLLEEIPFPEHLQELVRRCPEGRSGVCPDTAAVALENIDVQTGKGMKIMNGAC